MKLIRLNRKNLSGMDLSKLRGSARVNPRVETTVRKILVTSINMIHAVYFGSTFGHQYPKTTTDYHSTISGISDRYAGTIYGPDECD